MQIDDYFCVLWDVIFAIDMWLSRDFQQDAYNWNYNKRNTVLFLNTSKKYHADHGDFAAFLVTTVLKLRLSTFAHTRNAPRTSRVYC